MQGSFGCRDVEQREFLLGILRIVSDETEGSYKRAYEDYEY